MRDGLCDAIGNTPVARLRKACKLPGSTIFGKAELVNPGGSVKDRAALYIIRDAEWRGALRRQAGGNAAADPLGAATYHWFKHGRRLTALRGPALWSGSAT